MDFVAFTDFFSIQKFKRTLDSLFFGCKSGYNWQNCETWHIADCTFNMLRIVNLTTHHLVSTTNSVDCIPFFMAVEDRFCQSRLPKILQVGNCIPVSYTHLTLPTN